MSEAMIKQRLTLRRAISVRDSFELNFASSLNLRGRGKVLKQINNLSSHLKTWDMNS